MSPINRHILYFRGFVRGKRNATYSLISYSFLILYELLKLPSTEYGVIRDIKRLSDVMPTAKKIIMYDYEEQSPFPISIQGKPSYFNCLFHLLINSRGNIVITYKQLHNVTATLAPIDRSQTLYELSTKLI